MTTETNQDILWWGYRHTNGSIQVKRYWGDQRDLQEARESPFVKQVTSTFPAEGREDAIAKATERLA